ncbi:MAG: hypothetical protein COT37_01015, partial [Parcubacteria group bacterium CG08_land_8_20_14_0_20_43_9]
MLQDILNIIISPELQRALLPLKIVFIIFSFLLLGGIIYFLFTTSYLDHLLISDWRDYKYWRKHYGPLAVKDKKQLLKQKLKEQEARDSFDDFSAGAGKENVMSREAVEPAEAETGELRAGRVERTDWERVQDRLESKGELNYKLALIDADKIFIKILAKYGKEFSPAAISNFDEIVKAKEVLERMLDNPKTTLTQDRAKELAA